MPNDSAEYALLVRLVEASEAVDCLDVCTCEFEQPDGPLGSFVQVSPDCEACKAGMEWRDAYCTARAHIDGSRAGDGDA